MTARTGPNGADDQRRGQTQGPHLDTETLSAYLDGELRAPDELDRVRAHLASCQSCRRDLAELRTVVELLGEQLLPEAPRSFRLTPDMAAPAEPVEPAPIPWAIRVQPALRRLTALAAVLLVLVVTSDLIVHSRTQGTTAPAQEVTALHSGSGAASTSAPAALAPTAAARSAADQAGEPTEAARATTAGAAKSAAQPAAAASPAAQAQPALAGATAPTPAPSAAPAAVNRAEVATAASAPPGPSSPPVPGETATAAPFAVGAQSSATQPSVSTAAGAPQPTAVPSHRSRAFSLWRPLEIILGTLVVMSLAAMLTLPRLHAGTSRVRR